jgi:hypothetical protein
MVKGPSAKSKAAKAKREKMGVKESSVTDKLTDETRQRLEDSFERAYPNNDASVDTGWIDASYPSGTGLTAADIMTAEEAMAAEEKLLGKRGVDPIFSLEKLVNDHLNDDLPDFLQASVKAGPPLDALGRTPKERGERKPADAIALGEARMPAIVNPKAEKRATTIMRDHDFEYPALYMSVYVVPDWDVPDDCARFARLFARAGCYRADSIEEADLVVFGGGSDIEPLLYGESNENAHPTVHFNPERDAADIKVYLQARNQGTPMMGVCRGAQFLHVMNGGKAPSGYRRSLRAS